MTQQAPAISLGIGALLVCACVCSVRFAWAQQIPTALVNSHTFTTAEGLSQNNVYCIIKDPEGFMWIGTGDGLNRFDGYQFTKFFHSDEDSTSISNDVVRHLLLDSQGRLWIGTYNGLNLYDSETETFRNFLANGQSDKSISHHTILSLLEDSDHQLWVGTYHGLNRIDLKTLQITQYHHLPDGSGLSNDEISTLMEDREGKIWVCTAKGIDILGKNGVERRIPQDPSPGGLTSTLLSCIVQDSTGAIFIGTNGGGLLRLDNEYDRTFDYFTHSNKEYSLGNNIVGRLRIDRNGTLLVSTDGEGLYRYLGDGRFAKIRARENRILDHGSIQNIYVDDHNNYWVGLYGSGLVLISGDPVRFQHYRYFNSDMEQMGKTSVLAIVEDQNKKIWIGTDGAGLYMFDPVTEQFTTYLHSPSNPNSLTTNVVKSLLVDDRNNLYIGTYAGGMSYLDTRRRKFTHYAHDPTDSTSISTNHVWSLLQNREKRIFVGQLGGINEFIPDRGTFRPLVVPGGYPITNQTASVFCMAEDADGFIWMGTRLAGIHRYDPSTGSFRSFLKSGADSTGLPSNEILEFEFDAVGNLLVGTDDKGMIRFDTESFTFQRLIPAFSQRSIQSILVDDADNIWFTSSDGLHKHNQATGRTFTFAITDGLQGPHYNEGACLKSSTGQFYLGGTNGLNVFDPGRIVEDQSKPAVVFTRLALFHDDVHINDQSAILKKSLFKTDEIVLQPDQNVFSIEFACLEYRFPKMNKYRYRLQGFDEEWNEVNEHRMATYTNLPPGDYVLKVSASNADGYWHDEAATMRIVIIPRWHQRLDVRVAFFALLSIAILVTIHIRTRFLFRQKRKLEHMVKLRTEQIATQKEEIKDKNGRLELAYEEVKSVNDELHRMNLNLEKLVADKTVELRETIDKLIETDKGLDTFLYRSSHDLRGPITSLLGLAQVARMQNHQEDLAVYLGSMENTAGKMLRLLKRLSDTGALFRARYKPVAIHMHEFVQSVLLELNSSNPDNLVRVEINSFINTPIISDPSLLHLVVINLMENSIVFRGTEDPFVTCSIVDDNGLLIIKVTDNGIGISPTERDKLFEMFYRGSERSVGNGLGLFMVKKALEIVQGTIDIESRPLELTVVTVKIPLTHTDKEERVPFTISNTI